MADAAFWRLRAFATIRERRHSVAAVAQPDGVETVSRVSYTRALAGEPPSVVFGLAGIPYAIVATVLGCMFVWLAPPLRARRSMRTHSCCFSSDYVTARGLAALVADSLGLTPRDRRWRLPTSPRQRQPERAASVFLVIG